MKELPQIIEEIRGNRSQAEFAQDVGISRTAITRYESGERKPGYDATAALLRVADPPQQKALLEALGIEDVEQFATDLLASAGVKLIEVGGDGKEAP